MSWAQEHGLLVVGYSTLSGWPFLLRAVEDPHVQAHAVSVAVNVAVHLAVHVCTRL